MGQESGAGPFQLPKRIQGRKREARRGMHPRPFTKDPGPLQGKRFARRGECAFFSATSPIRCVMLKELTRRPLGPPKPNWSPTVRISPHSPFT